MGNKFSIKIQRFKFDVYRVTIKREGKEKVYCLDAPELKEHQDLIKWQVEMMKSMNADTASVSFK